MAITLVGTPQIGTAGDGDNMTLTFDGTPQEDDVVVVFGGFGADEESDPVGPLTSGYTEIAVPSSTAGAFGAWYKVLGPSPDASVQCAGGGDNQSAVAYGCYVLRGVDTDNVLDTTPVTDSSSSTDTPIDAPAITTVTDGAWVLAVAGDRSDTVFGVISGYDNQISDDATDTWGCAAGGATTELATAGTEDPPAWGGDDGFEWHAVTIAIRPAGAGGEVTGTAAGSYAFTGAANGTPTVVGSAAGSFGYTGTANGTATTTGSAAGSFAYSGTASGTPTVVGQAAASVTYAGAATGTATTTGSGSGSFGYSGAASGTVTVVGSAVASITYSGTASGGQPPLVNLDFVALSPVFRHGSPTAPEFRVRVAAAPELGHGDPGEPAFAARTAGEPVLAHGQPGEPELTPRAALAPAFTHGDAGEPEF